MSAPTLYLAMTCTALPTLPAASLVTLMAAHVALTSADPGVRGSKKKGTWRPPEFDETVPDQVTVAEGDPAALPCVVSRLRGRSVSWIRQRDLHVISANELTFTSDDRFKVEIDNASSSFVLHVAAALRNDSGVYECQVNTRPKLSRPVTLEVQVPSATIPGPSELYIKSGSTLVLSCSALLHPDATSSVSWLHNNSVLSIAGPRGGVSIHTERAGVLLSTKVSVVRAQARDAGIYTCRPDDVIAANVTVFIVEDEFPAAMHHDSGSRPTKSSLPSVVAWLTTLSLTHLAAR